VFALWLNRYLIVIPTLETPYMPIQDTRPDWISYHATWVEWSLTIAGLAVYGMAFMIASKLVPIISMSEMSHVDKVNELEEIEQIL